MGRQFPEIPRNGSGGIVAVSGLRTFNTIYKEIIMNDLIHAAHGFQASTARMKPQPAPKTKVLGGHFVPTALYMQVMAQVKSRMDTVKTNQLYVLKDICGNSFWSERLNNNWQKRMAGRCFAHMVHCGIFKFRFVRYKRYATMRYALIVSTFSAARVVPCYPAYSPPLHPATLTTGGGSHGLPPPLHPPSGPHQPERQPAPALNRTPYAAHASLQPLLR